MTPCCVWVDGACWSAVGQAQCDYDSMENAEKEAEQEIEEEEEAEMEAELEAQEKAGTQAKAKPATRNVKVTGTNGKGQGKVVKKRASPALHLIPVLILGVVMSLLVLYLKKTGRGGPLFMRVDAAVEGIRRWISKVKFGRAVAKLQKMREAATAAELQLAKLEAGGVDVARAEAPALAAATKALAETAQAVAARVGRATASSYPGTYPQSLPRLSAQASSDIISSRINIPAAPLFSLVMGSLVIFAVLCFRRGAFRKRSHSKPLTNE